MTEWPSAAARPPPEWPAAAFGPLAQLIGVVRSPTAVGSLHAGHISLRFSFGCLYSGHLLLRLGCLALRADTMRRLQSAGRGQLTECQRSRLSLVTWFLAEIMVPPTIYWPSPAAVVLGAAVRRRSQAEVQRQISTVGRLRLRRAQPLV